MTGSTGKSQRRRRNQWTADDPLHNPATGYRKKGCRCDRCRRWSTDDRQKRCDRGKPRRYTDADAIDDLLAVLMMRE